MIGPKQGYISQENVVLNPRRLMVLPPHLPHGVQAENTLSAKKHHKIHDFSPKTEGVGFFESGDTSPLPLSP